MLPDLKIIIYPEITTVDAIVNEKGQLLGNVPNHIAAIEIPFNDIEFETIKHNGFCYMQFDWDILNNLFRHMDRCSEQTIFNLIYAGHSSVKHGRHKVKPDHQKLLAILKKAVTTVYGTEKNLVSNFHKIAETIFHKMLLFYNENLLDLENRKKIVKGGIRQITMALEYVKPL